MLSMLHFNSHAHEGRDDKEAFVNSLMVLNFNSHAHEGRDNTGFDLDILNLISTHTPTRGVTAAVQAQLQAHNHFNSHAHEGRDSHSVFKCESWKYFNSHAHEGRDR